MCGAVKSEWPVLEQIRGPYDTDVSKVQIENNEPVPGSFSTTDVLRQTACLVVNPIKVNSFAYLFNCTTVDQASV